MSGPTGMLDDRMNLRGKVALVVGGGRGMGECSAMTFADAGCRVAVLDIDPARADDVAARIREAGGEAQAFVGDVLDSATVSALIERIEAGIGGIDVMVCIVGEARWGAFLDVTLEDFDYDHVRNLRYVFGVTQAVARSMARRGTGGSIIPIASVSGVQSAPNHPSYGAAKAGLMNLVRTMAVELAQHGIRVNAIAPGAIATPRILAMIPKAGEGLAAQQARHKAIPAGRMGTPQEIANAVLFLASDLASYVSGQTLVVDGGLTAGFALGTIDLPNPQKAAG